MFANALTTLLYNIPKIKDIVANNFFFNVSTIRMWLFTGQNHQHVPVMSIMLKSIIFMWYVTFYFLSNLFWFSSLSKYQKAPLFGFIRHFAKIKVQNNTHEITRVVSFFFHRLVQNNYVLLVCRFKLTTSRCYNYNCVCRSVYSLTKISPRGRM